MAMISVSIDAQGVGFDFGGLGFHPCGGKGLQGCFFICHWVSPSNEGDPTLTGLWLARGFFAQIALAENASPGLVCVKGDFPHEFDPRA